MARAPQTREPSIRFASIDLLRGTSILVMLILHAIMDTLDADYYISHLTTGSLINVVALILLPLLGGLAGLFLLTSAVGHMAGMTRNLQMGHAPLAVMRKQILGGMIIVMFAMLAEAVLGYHGAIGQMILSLDDLGSTDFSPMYSRAFHIETLHTIGWAEILNGITHCILASRIDIARETGRVIRIYWALVVLVVLLTPVVWWLCSWLIPGYPFATNPATGQPMYLPVIGTSAWHELLLYFFVNPLAAPVEPILPYLATSYVGSIIGLQITRDRDSFDRTFARRYFVVGMICFVTGVIGLGILLLNLMRIESMDAMIAQYRRIYDHRNYTTENGMPGGWFWQYLTLSGITLMIATLAFRLVELRGRGQAFAEQLSWIRRFGFIAFTIYTIQWVYFLMHYLVSTTAGLSPFTPLRWSGTWVVVLLSLLVLHVLMKVWEKCGYIGSAEWAIVSLTNCFSGIKKQVSTSEDLRRWYQQGRLDVDGIFYGPRWKDLDDRNTPEAEKRLIRWSSIAGLISCPFSPVAMALIRSYRRKHPHQPLRGSRLMTGTGLLLLLLTALLLAGGISLTDLGIAPQP